MTRSVFLVLFTLLPLALLSAQEEIVLAPPAGAYAAPQEVRISGPAPLEFRLAGNERFLPVEGPILLDAFHGIVERYRIEVRQVGSEGEVQSFDYTIDRRPPLPPVSRLPQGRYLGPVTVTFEESEELTLEYRKNGSYVPFPDSGLLLDPGSGRREVYTLRVRALDVVGNSSVSSELLYVVDRTYDALMRQEAEQRILLSPLPGSYRNQQLLLPEYRLWEDVRFTTDGSDPANGTRLTEPTLLPGSGEIELRVSAVSLIDGSRREESVLLRQGRQESPFPVSGIHRNQVLITPPAEGRYSFALGGRDPGRRGQLLLGSVELEPPPGNRRFVFFSSAPAGSTESVFGHAYLLDDRIPPEPTVLLQRFDAGSLLLTAFSLPEARIRYEVRGVEAPGSYDYGEPTLLTIPEGTGERTVALTVYAELPGGARSEEVRRELRLMTSAPEPPRYTLRERTPSESVELFIDSPEAVYLGPMGAGESRIPPNALIDEPFLSFTPPPGEEGRRTFSLRSVSQDGWLWSSSVAVEAFVDTLPPEAPRISLRGDRFRVFGRGFLEYRVSADLEAAPSNTDGFVPYEGGIRLEAPSGSVVRYTLEARSRDEAGNLSSIVSESYRADDRRAEIPPIRGIQDGGRYREAELYLIFQNPYPEDLELFYEIREGERRAPTPAIPDRSSPSVRERLRIDTPEGVEREYRIRLRAGLPEGPLSETAEIGFSVDRVPPEPPAVRLPGSGSPYARDVEVRLIGGEGERYIAVSDGEPLDPLGPRGQRYAAPVRVTGVNGEAITFTVTAASRDSAGNVSRMEEPVQFLLDREPPEPPVIRVSGTPQEGRAVRSRSAEISLEGEGSLFLSYSRTGRSATLREYTGEPISVAGEEGSVVSYRVEAFSIDAAGNRSATRRLELVMDRERPELIPEPELIYAPDGRSGTLVWPDRGEGELYLARSEGLLFAGRAPETEAPLGGTLRWRLGEESEEGVLFVYVQDSAGNRSEEQRIVLAERTEPPAPAFTGLPDGGVTRESVELRFQPRGPEPVVVRYTVSTDGTLPPSVSSESPRFDGRRTFGAGRGERISYVLSARAFNEAGEMSEPQVLRFTVDREPPEAPTIRGVTSGEYYPEAQAFTLSGEGEVYYRVLEQGRRGGAEEFKVYQGDEVMLPAEENELLAYQIEAYSRDEAGNRSQEVSQWNVFIDREIIYVSASSGSDSNDGGRSAPFATLNAALELFRETERSTIFLQAGLYTLDRGLRFQRPVRIIGGFEGEGWRPGEGRSSLRLLSDSEATAERAGKEAAVSFALGSGGSLTLRRVDLTSRTGRPLVRIESGASFFLEESLLDSDAHVAVEVQGGDLRVTNASILVPRGGRAIEGGQGSSLELSGSELSPIELNRVDYTIVDSVLTATPITTEAATALVARESRGTLRDSVVRSDAREEQLLLLEIVAGRLRIEGSEIVGEAGTGITLLRSRNSDITIDRSELRAAGASSYLYGVISRGGNMVVTNSLLTATESNSALGFSIQGGALDFAHNTVLFGSLRQSYLFSVGNLSRLTLYNSQLHQLRLSGNGEHTLLYLDDRVESLRIAGNNIAGWTRILTDGAAAGSSWGFISPGVLRRVDELHRSTVRLPSVLRFEAFENISESAERTFASGQDVLAQQQFDLQIGSASVRGGVPIERVEPEGVRRLLEVDFEGEGRDVTAARPDIGSHGSVHDRGD